MSNVLLSIRNSFNEKNIMALSLLGALLVFSHSFAYAQRLTPALSVVGSVGSGKRSFHSQAPPPISFTFGTIDYPNGPDTVAQAVNGKGVIVGSWGPDINDFRQGLPAYGFELKGTAFKKIVFPNAPITVPMGVNISGEIVGFYSTDPFDNSGHGFTLVGNTFSTVDYPGSPQYSMLSSINKSGEIVGSYNFQGGFTQGFLLNNGAFSPIAFPGAVDTAAYGIDDAGDIVGTYSNDNVTGHGFTLINGVYTTVDPPGAVEAAVSGINNNGQMVGFYTDTNSITHGFLLQNGTFTTLDSPYAGVAATLAWGINDKAVIVGQTIDLNNFFLGFEVKVGP
jgi:probable HAF family extracellular repeat protein